MREPTSTSERPNKVVSVPLRRRIVFATATLSAGAFICAVAAEAATPEALHADPAPLQRYIGVGL